MESAFFFLRQRQLYYSQYLTKGNSLELLFQFSSQHHSSQFSAVAFSPSATFAASNHTATPPLWAPPPLSTSTRFPFLRRSLPPSPSPVSLFPAHTLPAPHSPHDRYNRSPLAFSSPRYSAPACLPVPTNPSLAYLP